jgi:hypothetical protein
MQSSRGTLVLSLAASIFSFSSKRIHAWHKTKETTSKILITLTFQVPVIGDVVLNKRHAMSPFKGAHRNYRGQSLHLCLSYPGAPHYLANHP